MLTKYDEQYAREYARRNNKSFSEVWTRAKNIDNGSDKYFTFPSEWNKVNNKLPKYMLTNARKGIKLYEEGKNGRGLVPATVAWIRRSLRTGSLPPFKIRDAKNWINRHQNDKKLNWDKKGEETPGYVAFLLWWSDGDGRAKKWFSSKWDEYQKIEKEPKTKDFIIPIFDLDKYNLTKEQVREYNDSLQSHLKYVKESCVMLGVPESQYQIHDLSKYSLNEFPEYVRSFYGDGNNKIGFKYAWNHHLHNNPHHWQHWILHNGDTGVVETLEMPEKYILEMVGDWLGASKAYTGSYDITEWLENRKGRILLHPNSYTKADEILQDLSYKKDIIL